ncbi:MAG: three component ABC system middle component [Segatella copri]
MAITALAIMSMLSVSPRIPLSKVALLMPILLDDNITQKMTYQNYNSFDSVVTQNQAYLSNFNDRYIDLLSQVVNGISILLDLNLVSLYGEFVIAENAASYESILSKCDSKRFVCIQTAASKLLKLVKDADIAYDYHKLNIEL